MGGPFETARAGSEAALDKDEVVCDDEDAHVAFIRDVKDCSMYYVCQGAVKHHKPCPTGLVFNENENVCDWPENVEECDGKKTSLPFPPSAETTRRLFRPKVKRIQRWLDQDSAVIGVS